MTEPLRILIVEDDLPLARSLARFLEREGYESSIAVSAADLRRRYREKGADLILLDLNLGADDGMDLLEELSRTTAASVIVVTGRGDVEDRIRGLENGADDYMTKPIELRELLARVRAVMRRQLAAADPESQVVLGPLRLDATARILRCDGVEAAVALTETQVSILGRLMRHPGRAVGRGDLLSRGQWSPVDRSADVHIGHIRRKLDEAGMGVVSIQAVRGHGYCLTLRSESARSASEPASARPASTAPAPGAPAV